MLTPFMLLSKYLNGQLNLEYKKVSDIYRATKPDNSFPNQRSVLQIDDVSAYGSLLVKQFSRSGFVSGISY